MTGAADATVRAFLAVDLPEPARQCALAAAEALREALELDARWAPPEQLHLTLKFLGDVTSDALAALARNAGGRLAAEKPFAVTVGGIGAFPSNRQARILWMGVQDGQPALARLARKLDRSAGRIGVERDRRPYRAHVSLARLRDAVLVRLDQVATPDPVSFPVEEVVLYESRLAGTGATHVPLARLPLGLEGRDAFDPHELAPEL